MIAAIPAPPFDSIGPFRLYGLMIALGVLAAVMIAQHRWSRWGGDDDAIVNVAIWAVPAGLIGARLYHVITDWESLYSGGRWSDAFKIWKGGLGIPGGVLVGALVGIVVARRTVPSWRRLGDAVAPAIPVAQAIGRLGNYFNQELYGRATGLPWGLRVDDRILLAQNPDQLPGTTFHPTFLYEALWNLALAGVIIWGGAKVVFKPGRWFALYVAGYGLGRLWVESLRIDTATHIAGLRVNIWMSLVIIIGGLLWLLWDGGPVDRDATALLRRGADPVELFGAQTSFASAGAVSAGGDPEAEGEPVAAGGGPESEGWSESERTQESEGTPEAEDSAEDSSEEVPGGAADTVGERGPEPD